MQSTFYDDSKGISDQHRYLASFEKLLLIRLKASSDIYKPYHQLPPL